MNKTTLGIILVIVLTIGGGLVYLSSSSSNKTRVEDLRAKNTETVQSDMPTNAVERSRQTTGGAYVDYTGTVIASTKGTKLLFFHAPWCPQCRVLEADIKQQTVPAGVTIIKVDYDSNQALRQKYGVTLQTTIVRIDDQGNLIKKFVAYDNPSLEAIKENLL